MFGYGKNPESGNNREYIKLPQPLEYTGSFIERTPGKSKDQAIHELEEIINLSEKQGS